MAPGTGRRFLTVPLRSLGRPGTRVASIHQKYGRKRRKVESRPRRPSPQDLGSGLAEPAARSLEDLSNPVSEPATVLAALECLARQRHRTSDNSPPASLSLGAPALAPLIQYPWLAGRAFDHAIFSPRPRIPPRRAPPMRHALRPLAEKTRVRNQLSPTTPPCARTWRRVSPSCRTWPRSAKAWQRVGSRATQSAAGSPL
jgi:hypothetical protein